MNTSVGVFTDPSPQVGGGPVCGPGLVSGGVGGFGRVRPPMPYAGGKQGLAERIVGLFPAHAHYVEPFGGGLSVLLAKAPVAMETVNDLHRDLVTFWRVLRDRPEDLERVCALTPHSRAEHATTRRDDEEVVGELEQARRVWVQLTQSRGAQLGTKSGWRYVTAHNHTPMTRYLKGYLARFAPVVERLHGVSLENRRAVEVIEAYQTPETLIYVDPPYHPDVRTGRRQYACEMRDPHEHEQLLRILVASPAMVAISGYPNRMYNSMLSGWNVHRFTQTDQTRTPRTELVWTNYTPEPALFTLDGGHP